MDHHVGGHLPDQAPLPRRDLRVQSACQRVGIPWYPHSHLAIWGIAGLLIASRFFTWEPAAKDLSRLSIGSRVLLLRQVPYPSVSLTTGAS